MGLPTAHTVTESVTLNHGNLGKRDQDENNKNTVTLQLLCSIFVLRLKYNTRVNLERQSPAGAEWSATSLKITRRDKIQ